MKAQTFIEQMNSGTGFALVLTTAEEIETLLWLQDNDALTDEDEARLMELVCCYEH